MTPTEIKAEIHRIVDLLPEKFQIDFLNQLREFQKDHEEKKQENFEKIIRDNAGLLKRLAE